MMKLRSSPPWNSPASSVGFPLKTGATCRISFELRKATICSGTDRFTFALGIRVPNTERICAKWSATSRPRLSPASVITEKFGERTSTHSGSPAKLWFDHRMRHPSAKQALKDGMTALPRETARDTNGTAQWPPSESLFLVNTTKHLSLLSPLSNPHQPPFT